MPTSSDRPTLIAALDDVWDHLIDLGQDLSEDRWESPTEVPGWSVKDNYSHIIGTELMLLDRPDPTIDIDDADHIKNDIGRFNEVSIIRRRDTPGADVLAELTAVIGDRRGALADMTDDDFAKEGFTPAGTDTYARFMQIRVMDCWVHEQDVRTALESPGHLSGPAVDVALDEITKAMGFVVGKKGGAPDGSSVRIELTGDTPRAINVAVEGRAAVVDDLDDPTTTITVPGWLFVRYAAGRRPNTPDHDAISIAGDTDLGRQIVSNLAYMI